MKGIVAITLVFGFAIFMTSCKNGHDPKKHLSEQDQYKLIRQSVYYSAKLPPNGNHQTKFSKDYDWYYDLAAKETKLLKYAKGEDGSDYFLMSRKARSITPMQEGIGGKLRVDPSGKLIAYEEIFRTWKMPEDSLRTKGAMLFERMVKGKDLTLYYSKYQADRFIEFPDDRFFFDKETMSWKDRDSVVVRDPTSSPQ